jgi:RNA polymerase sigma-70 factor (ECF subfamily)
MQNDSRRPSDADLVRQILDGNVNAFESQVTRHEVLVLMNVKKHVPPHEVEETVQNVFVRTYRSLPTFKGKSQFSQWLSSIAVRACYDYWRKAYQSQEVPMCALTEKHREWLGTVMSEESEQAVDEEGSQEEARELLDLALATLSAEDRMVLELVYLEGLSVKEAANRLGWSMSNVKVRSFRARRKLEKYLREIMPEERKTP